MHRIELFVLMFLTVVVACKKSTGPGNGPGNGPDYTETPAAAPVSSKLMVYALGNNQSSNPLNVQLNAGYIDFNSKYIGFPTSNAVLLDKYNTTIAASPSLTVNLEGYTPRKTFTTSDAIKNYVNVKLLPLASAGYVIYDDGSGTLSLPNNGQLALPPYSFGVHPGSVSFWVLCGFTSPSVTDYAVNLPCYPMADENGKRWFLNSYGVYLFSPYATDNSWFDIDFSPNANVILRMPVPANQPVAPDSIPAWNINNKNMWERNGYARKVGSFYEKKITKKGYWNFALPVNGVYTTFRLQASTGHALPNIRYVIKNEGAEVAEGRTNSNGIGVAFVPTNKQLTIDLYSDHQLSLSAKIQNMPFGNFNKASEITLTLPERRDIYTLEANVLDCSGKSVANGYAGIETFLPNDEYVFAITNGKLSAAQWIGSGGFIPATVTLYNNANASIITHPFVVGSPTANPANFRSRFYTCLSAPQLYCNYRIDTASYSITGDINTASPELNSKDFNLNDTRISMMNSGKGIRFDAWFTNTGGAYVSVNNMEINGVPAQLDHVTGTSEIFFYRNDKTPGGIREGWFYIYYKDAGGGKHTITGNFRIRIG